MRRYDINFVMTLDFDEVIEMYVKAKNEIVLDKLWQQYLIDYGNMDKESFIGFDEYKSKAFIVKVKLDKNKILADALKIKEADQKGGN